MTFIRPATARDAAEISEICLRTADAGDDASGILLDDDLWATVFALPYLERHPDLSFVVVDDDGTVNGYIVATDDTDQFEQWFRELWWPRYVQRWPMSTNPVSRQDSIVSYAYGRGDEPLPLSTGYPAHLHIDLLPRVQGQGWGRRLVDTLIDALRDRGTSGLHAIAASENVGSHIFYERTGFTPLPVADGGQAFGIRLAP
ncbi:MAG: putative acetyltransferase OT [Glaciihabitans sp.]|nr:putative acetyltransferase OT [Glaciihabitans sp.]